MTSRRDVIKGAGALLAASFLANGAQARPKLNIVSSSVSRTMPRMRLDFPVPSDKNQIFFVQRTSNANTVVYAARFDSAGNLDAGKPVANYWRRYATNGRRKPLKWIEQQFAYGMRWKRSGKAGSFKTWIAALPDYKFELRQDGPNQASLWTRINNRDFQLVYGFLDLDESGMIPKVVRLHLCTYAHGKGEFVTHLATVSGGDLSE